jgi:hypothetical protein
MAKHAKKSDHLQIVDLPKTTTVEVPLPLLGIAPLAVDLL